MNETRIGDWMQVAKGGRFYPLDPRPEEIHIEDIAAALAKLCRFGGHCREFYSVAEHSVRVSEYLQWLHANTSGALEPRRLLCLHGLLHDASEAYLVDLPRPIKRNATFANYRITELNLSCRIFERFGLRSDDMPWAVHNADETLLVTEARDLMNPGDWTSYSDIEARALPERITPWTWQEAEARFLARFHQLTA